MWRMGHELGDLQPGVHCGRSRQSAAAAAASATEADRALETWRCSFIHSDRAAQCKPGEAKPGAAGRGRFAPNRPEHRPTDNLKFNEFLVVIANQCSHPARAHHERFMLCALRGRCLNKSHCISGAPWPLFLLQKADSDPSACWC